MNGLEIVEQLSGLVRADVIVWPTRLQLWEVRAAAVDMLRFTNRTRTRRTYWQIVHGLIRQEEFRGRLRDIFDQKIAVFSVLSTRVEQSLVSLYSCNAITPPLSHGPSNIFGAGTLAPGPLRPA